VVLSIALVLAIFLLGLSASQFGVVIRDYTTNAVFAYRPFFVIASSAGTILVVPVLLVVDLICSTPLTSIIVVELSCLMVLSTLWIVVAGYTKSIFDVLYDGNCTLTELHFGERSIITCQTISAIGPISLTAAILLVAYTVFLFICCIIASSRGQKVWMNSVRLTSFFGPAEERGDKLDLTSNRHTIPVETFAWQNQQHLSMVTIDQYVVQQPAPPYYPQDWEVCVAQAV